MLIDVCNNFTLLITWIRLRTKTLNSAYHSLGFLYADQGKLAEAEKMYKRALDGKEKAWGPEHTSFDDMIKEANIKTWVKANLEKYKEKLRPRDPNRKKYPK